MIDDQQETLEEVQATIANSFSGINGNGQFLVEEKSVDWVDIRDMRSNRSYRIIIIETFR